MNSKIVEKKMVISPEDTEAVKKFFDHFKIDMPKSLVKSIKDFQKNPNLKTQKRLVIEVNLAISGENSIDQLDDMFKPVVECAKEATFYLEFDDELENVLTETQAQKAREGQEQE